MVEQYNQSFIQIINFIYTYYNSESDVEIDKGLDYLKNVMIVSESVMMNIFEYGILQLISALIESSNIEYIRTSIELIHQIFSKDLQMIKIVFEYEKQRIIDSLLNVAIYSDDITKLRFIECMNQALEIVY